MAKERVEQPPKVFIRLSPLSPFFPIFENIQNSLPSRNLMKHANGVYQ